MCVHIYEGMHPLRNKRRIDVCVCVNVHIHSHAYATNSVPDVVPPRNSVPDASFFLPRNGDCSRKGAMTVSARHRLPSIREEEGGRARGGEGGRG